MTLTMTKTALRMRLLSATIALALAAWPAALAAECQAANSDGTARDCTATEELGYCMENVRESLRQCLDGGGGSLRCGFAAFLDDLACVASLIPKILVEPILN